ncbi:MAG: HAD family hydrolase [Elusimicrobiota bacterium]
MAAISAFKAVLFDLDGTLLDTLSDIANCVNRLRLDSGLRPHPRAAYRGFVGNGVVRLMKRAFPPRVLRGSGLTALTRRFEILYAARCLDEAAPYPGVVRMLDALRRRRLPLAILSNKPQRFTNRCVDELLPGRRFAVVLGARPGVPLKPDPAGALAAARALRIDPAEIAYVGDTGVDMKTARAAGMFPIGVLWGFRGAAELKRGGARVLIRRPGELPSLFAGG